MDVGITEDVLNGSVPYEISSEEDKSDSDADADLDGNFCNTIYLRLS